MTKQITYNAPFGNTLSRRALALTGISYTLCHALYGSDTTTVKAAAVARGEVYRDFGVLTIVNRADPEATRSDHAGGVPLKLYDIDPGHAVIIGTIRMGFGHWRIAIALASAAHYLGYTPYLLDLMSFKGTTAAKSIQFLESWYNRASRFSQSWKWFNKHVWEKCTSAGGLKLNSCVRERRLSSLFVPVFAGLPKDMPLLSAHPWVGHAAVLAGMKHVVSVIPDNLPMAFWLVEGSTHTVQSPSACMGYRTLISMECAGNKISHCLRSDEIHDTGHYVDYEIVSNIETDCSKRLMRCSRGEPRRFLLTMGGAGAQAERFADIAISCRKEIENGKAALFINMGDHKGRWTDLEARLRQAGITWTMHTDWEQTLEFIQKSAENTVRGVHVFLHDDFYAAVYATNLLMRISDIMITKPSELSFYPVPKLFIHRVGRHEAWGAIRGSEMGDGTIEADDEDTLHRTLHELINRDDLLKMFIRHILLNHKAGIYDGAYNTVKTAAGLVTQD
jgi:hypothetical protein